MQGRCWVASMTKHGSTTLIWLSLLVSGCTSITTTATNPISKTVKPPVIDTLDKVARIEVGESVVGFGCSDDKHLLILPDPFDINNPLDRAKAAAAYDALFGDMKDHPPVYYDKQQPFPNDQLLAPTFHVEERVSWWASSICVAVSGYRGRLVEIRDGKKTSRDVRAENVSSLQVLSIVDDTNHGATTANAKSAEHEPMITEEGYRALRRLLIESNNPR